MNQALKERSKETGVPVPKSPKKRCHPKYEFLPDNSASKKVIEHADFHRRNMTTSEKEVHKYFTQYSIPHICQYPIFTGKEYYILDFAIIYNRIKICIEIDGGYHRKSPIVISDCKRDRRLRGMGFKVLRMTNEYAMQHVHLLIGSIRDFGVPIKKVELPVKRELLKPIWGILSVIHIVSKVDPQLTLLSQ